MSDGINIRIESNGLGTATTFTTPDGERLDWVQRATWSIDSKTMVAEATLHLEAMPADLTVKDPRIILELGGQAVPLPRGLNVDQVRSLQDSVGSLLLVIDDLCKQRRSLCEQVQELGGKPDTSRPLPV